MRNIIVLHLHQGLFLLPHATDYWTYYLKDEDKIQVRRTHFKVVPADSRIVYAAQGEGFEAVVLDLARPPRMDAGVHWLAIYVMLSRATTLEGVLLLRMCERADLERAPPKFLLDELDRLAKLEQSSWTAVRQALTHYKPHMARKTWEIIAQSFASSTGLTTTPESKISAARKRALSPDSGTRASTPATVAGAPPTPTAPTPPTTPVRRVRGKTTPDRIKRTLEESPCTRQPETGTSPAFSCPTPPASGVASVASQKAADAAAERRRADKARGLGPVAAARLEEEASKSRPTPSAASRDNWFGAGAAHRLRETLRTSSLPASGSSASAATPAETAITMATGASGPRPLPGSGAAAASSATVPQTPPTLQPPAPETFSPPPLSVCTTWRHVCDPPTALRPGCGSCDNTCHRDNTDPLCPYHQRARNTHRDAALGDNVAHMSQTDIVLWKNGVRLHTDTPLAPRWFHGHRVEVSVDNMRFEIGTATGEGCNCLIDALRRQLNALPSVLIPESCLPEVRRLLEQRHRHGPTPITTGDYLDLAHYWEDIVNLLWKHDRIGLQPRRSAKFFEIICADLTYIDNGERLPRDRDPSRDRGLYVARVNENHFVPLSRFVDERVLRPVPPLRGGADDPTIAAVSEAAL